MESVTGKQYPNLEHFDAITSVLLIVGYNYRRKETEAN